MPARSLDDLGHAEEAMLGHRGVGEDFRALAAAGQRVGIDHVLAQAQRLGLAAAM